MYFDKKLLILPGTGFAAADCLYSYRLVVLSQVYDDGGEFSRSPRFTSILPCSINHEG